jgi:hypothetical protein
MAPTAASHGLKYKSRGTPKDADRWHDSAAWKESDEVKATVLKRCAMARLHAEGFP